MAWTKTGNILGPQGPKGDPGGFTVVGLDEDGVPYFDPNGVAGGAFIQMDEDDVPYFLIGA